jgi:hypothetical protein
LGKLFVCLFYKTFFELELEGCEKVTDSGFQGIVKKATEEKSNIAAEHETLPNGFNPDEVS